MDTEPTPAETTDESPAENLPATPSSGPTDDDAVPVRTSPPSVDARYAGLELAHGHLVVYDRENTDAWLQTDRPITLEDGGALDG